MTTRGINNGINKLVKRKTEPQRMAEQLESNWRNIKGKIDSILLSTKQYKSNEVMQMCRNIDDLPSVAERAEYITTHWGQSYTNKLAPLLEKLSELEDIIKRNKAEST